jgi:cobalt-precorrin 5A hydrolase
MKLAFVTLSSEGVSHFENLTASFHSASFHSASFHSASFHSAEFFIYEKVESDFKCERFSSLFALVRENFLKYEGFVFIAPAGAVVRALDGNMKDKKTDPAVVQVDVGGRYAVSLLSGHEGGANLLAVAVANAIGAEPVISTSTEAVKKIIVGVGCRRGKVAGEIVKAVESALAEADLSLGSVRLMASADIKSDEEGLIEAARLLDLPLRFIPSEDIRSSKLEFERSEFVQKKVNLPAVAEPAALLAGRRTSLLLKRRKYDGITVAVATENSL